MSIEVANLFSCITTGVYVVGVISSEGQYNAFTATWVMPSSFQPPLLTLSINPRHISYQWMCKTKIFSVNVLSTSQLKYAAHFGTPSHVHTNKLDGIPWHTGKTGTPLLKEALAWFECTVCGEFSAGDHSLITGQVIRGKRGETKSDIDVLLYRDTENIDGASNLFPDGTYCCLDNTIEF